MEGSSDSGGRHHVSVHTVGHGRALQPPGSPGEAEGRDRLGGGVHEAGQRIRRPESAIPASHREGDSQAAHPGTPPPPPMQFRLQDQRLRCQGRDEDPGQRLRHHA